MSLLTDQFNEYSYKDPKRQRIYLKDIDCPSLWHEKLQDIIPPSLFYLNIASKAEFKGPGSSHHDKAQKGASKPSDLMSCLPADLRAENLMCYIGHEGTYTAAHSEMCGTLGHNIMVEASNDGVENGKFTRPGSSLWFMTESKDRDVVSEYWMSILGHDIAIEDHFAQINAWKVAPFKTYIVEQKPGDFILIPSLAAHQVWNRGTRTTKVAWNRTTVETLELALNGVLAQARMVCRDEQYKNKAIVLYSCEYYSALLQEAREKGIGSRKVKQLLRDFERLLSLYTQILLSESFSDDPPRRTDFLPYDGSVTCSYCRCNIFNRFLTCPWCVEKTEHSGEDITYDICMECYILGRSCSCISRLTWVEQFRWRDLTEKHEHWRQQLFRLRGFVDDDYQCISMEKQLLGKKTLTSVCQEQLRVRPWVNIAKSASKETTEKKESDSEQRPRKRRKQSHRFEKWSKENPNCHFCKTREPSWKQATCSFCSRPFCYGSLFRAFNIHPLSVMERSEWMCPRCLKICSCTPCRRDPCMEPFEPVYTFLEHDTKKIADPRSVESLVDLRHLSSKWFKKSSRPTNHLSQQQHRRNEAEKEFLSEHDNVLRSSEPLEDEISQLGNDEDIPIDPAL